jgi:protocatechuate 3,4-dioxygenase alpha subunit
VPEDRRSTLIAQRQDFGAVPTYRFDIHLQGAKETVFFNL